MKRTVEIHLDEINRAVAKNLDLLHARSSVSSDSNYLNLVTNLKSLIAQQNLIIADLRIANDQLLNPDISDEEKEVYKGIFKEELKKLSSPTISQIFTKERLLDYTPSIRYVLCLCLLSTFHSRNLTPDAAWVEASNNLGEFK